MNDMRQLMCPPETERERLALADFIATLLRVPDSHRQYLYGYVNGMTLNMGVSASPETQRETA